MKKKSFVSDMKLGVRLLLAFAVFLIFGTHGPSSALAAGVIDPVPVARLLFTALASGGLAAGIILTLDRPWLLVFVVVGFVVLISDNEKISNYLSGSESTLRTKIDAPVTITPAQFGTMQQSRMVAYGMNSAMIGLGWAMFAIVFNSEARRRGRIESEVEIAKGIQRSLLPPGPLKTPTISVCGKTVPTSEVGGDYFDFIKTKDGGVAVVIADVAGHGVGAGIIAAMTKSALYLQVSKDPSPSQVMSSLNEALAQITDRKTFVTCAYVLVSPDGRTATYATAGHPAFLLRTSEPSQVHELVTKNLALGVMKGVQFVQGQVALGPGDTLLLYTDGISESASKSSAFFGVEGVKDGLATLHGDLELLCESVIDSSLKHSGSREFKDDATVVCVGIS